MFSVSVRKSRSGTKVTPSLNQRGLREIICMTFGSELGHLRMVLIGHAKGLSSSGSNQAREGRLVNALAVRGDEGRDTLR